MTTATVNDRIAVVATYLLWRARAERCAHPEGHFDGGGRWYPSERERVDGFDSGLRSPSRAWPFSLLVGARTRKHAAALVAAALDGAAVPADAASAVAVARELVEASVAAESATPKRSRRTARAQVAA